MPDSEYHHRQAAVLIKLAQATRDHDTAASLMRLAAEHTELAEGSTATNRKSGARH